jgi:hypothetical protein
MKGRPQQGLWRSIGPDSREKAALLGRVGKTLVLCTRLNGLMCLKTDNMQFKMASSPRYDFQGSKTPHTLVV